MPPPSPIAAARAAAVSPSRRSETTTWSANASTPAAGSPGCVRRSAVVHVAGGSRPAAPSPARSPRRRRCAGSGSRSPAACSTSYSTPSRRGATTRGSPSGRPRPSSQHLAGDLAADADHDELLAAGQPDAHPEPLVGLLVAPRRRRRGVPTRAARPGRAARRRRPSCRRASSRRRTRRRRSAVSGDLVRQQLAGAQVLDPQREALVAGEVGGVGQQPAVGADARRRRARRTRAPRPRRCRRAGPPRPASARRRRRPAGSVVAGGRRAAVDRRTAGPRPCGRSTSRPPLRVGTERSVSLVRALISSKTARRSSRGARSAPRCTRSRPQVRDHLRVVLVAQPLVSSNRSPWWIRLDRAAVGDRGRMVGVRAPGRKSFGPRRSPAAAARARTRSG